MYKVGQQFRRWEDRSRRSWSESGPRPLNTVIWYPTDDATEPQDFGIAGPVPLFVLPDIVNNGPLRATPRTLPVVVLSHGTGGTAVQLGWLGRSLAAQGYVAVAVDHHGNTANEPYLPHGFLLWWERAKDLTAVLNCLAEDPLLGHRVDVARVGMAGFSLGGYTGVLLAGGRCSLDHFRAFSRVNSMASIAGPREFPEVCKMWEDLLATDAAFRHSVAEHRHSHRDPRIRAAFLMNPALGGAFDAKGLSDINIPVHIVVTEEDREVPPHANGCRYAELIRRAELTWINGPAGHYVFLALPTAVGKQQLPHLCHDDPSVDRASLHEQASNLAARFFEQHLRNR